jgi:short-subunit dehydrogenase
MSGYAPAMQLRHTTTLVTGASAGLGREIARLIVREQAGSVVVVARRQERLEELREEFRSAPGSEVIPIVADLATTEGATRCFDEATTPRRIDGVILNAGITFFGKCVDQTPESIQSIIATNVTGMSLLATRFAKHFVDNQIPGRIMLVASMSGFSPMPYQAVYGATKAYVISFGQALREELRNTGVTVTVFCPGGITTEMSEYSGLSKTFGPDHAGMMDAVTCARYAVDGYLGRGDIAIPGASNWVASVAQRVMPRGLVTRAVERIYRGAMK